MLIMLTGATGGIGRAIAHTLAQEAHQLILVGRSLSKLEALADTLQGQHFMLAADLLQPEGIQHIHDFLEQRGLQPDVLINNAGTNQLALFEESHWPAIEQQIQLNLMVPMAICHTVLPFMPQGGHIINMGSVLGEIGYPGYVAYSASKGGLKRFSEALRRELTDQNIDVSYLAPRAVDTPLNSPNAVELNKALNNAVDSPQTVANAVLKLIKAPQRQLIIGRAEAFFSRINALFPALVDGSISKQLHTIRQFCGKK